MEELRASMEALNARLQAQGNVVHHLQGERQQLQHELQPASSRTGAFKMKSYLGAVDHRYQGKLMEAEQSQVTIRNARMESDVARLSTQLYYILVMTTSGSALDKCHNAGVKEGFEAWRQFVLRSRSQSSKKIDDDEKIGVVLLGMEGPRVNEHLIRNSAGLDAWPKVREDILDIARTQQYVDSRPTTTQLGAIPRGGKDKGGKADGGNNPNSEKELLYCRKRGHVKADCRKRQRDLAAAENRRGPLDATPGGQTERTHFGGSAAAASPATAMTAVVGAAAEPARVFRLLGALPNAAAGSGSAPAVPGRDADRPVPVLAATRTDAQYLMIDTCAGASAFPRRFDSAAEGGPAVGPARLETTTDDLVIGDSGKQSRFGLQDGRQVMARCNEAEVKFPIVSVGEVAGQGNWFLFGTGHQVMLPSEASP
ncbi:unnamed protein product, partial [Prorocentrum cordatum]